MFSRSGGSVEVVERGGPQAVHAVAEVDAGEIAPEDLGLGEPQFEGEGDEQLRQLAAEGPVGAQEGGLRQLLGDGASAFPHVARAQVDHRRAHQPHRIDAPVVIEAVILDGDEGGRDIGRQACHVDRRLLVGTSPRERPAVRGHQHQRGVGKRLQGPGTGKHEREEADDQQAREHQDQRRREQPSAPPARGGAGRLCKGFPRAVPGLDLVSRAVTVGRPRERTWWRGGLSFQAEVTS